MSENFCTQHRVEEKVRDHNSKQALQELLSDAGVEVVGPPKEETSEDEDMGFDNLKPLAASGCDTPAHMRGKGNKQQPGPHSPKGKGSEYKLSSSLVRGNAAAGSGPAAEDLMPPPMTIPSKASKGRGKQQKSKQAAAQEAAITASAAKTQKLFEDKKQMYGDAALWNGGLKRRGLQTAIKQLDEGAQKLVGDPEWDSLVSDIQAFNESVLEKYDLFANIKKDLYFCTALPDDQADLLTHFSPHLVAQVLVHTTNQWLKDIDHQDRMRRKLYSLQYLLSCTVSVPVLILSHFDTDMILI